MRRWGPSLPSRAAHGLGGSWDCSHKCRAALVSHSEQTLAQAPKESRLSKKQSDPHLPGHVSPKACPAQLQADTSGVACYGTDHETTWEGLVGQPEHHALNTPRFGARGTFEFCKPLAQIAAHATSCCSGSPSAPKTVLQWCLSVLPLRQCAPVTGECCSGIQMRLGSRCCPHWKRKYSTERERGGDERSREMEAKCSCCCQGK